MEAAGVGFSALTDSKQLIGKLISLKRPKSQKWANVCTRRVRGLSLVLRVAAITDDRLGRLH